MTNDLASQLANVNITGNEPTQSQLHGDGGPNSKVKITAECINAHGIADEDNTIGTTSFARLPNEILTLIIKQLIPHQIPFQLPLVNKHFHAVANPILWHTQILDDDFSTEPFMAHLERIAQYQPVIRGCQHIRVLYLDDYYWTDDRLLWLVSKTCNLEYLSLDARRTRITGTIHHLPSYCTNLQALELHYISISYDFFISLGQYCHQLSDLTIQNCNYITSSSSPPHEDPLVPIVTGCPLLKSLYISYHRMDGENLFNEITTNTIPTMISTLKNMHELTILCLTGSFPSSIIPPILSPTQHWPHLTTLDLSNCHDLDDITLIRFLRSRPALEELRFEDATQLTDACLDTMTANWLSRLKRVVWSNNANFSLEGVRRWIRQSGPALVLAGFNHCKHILPADFFLPSHHGYVHLDRAIINTIRQAHQQNNHNSNSNSNNSNNH